MTRALENLFLKSLEEHQHKLLRICSVYAKNKEDTEDLFQEVLIQIWKSMPTFEGKASVGTWMYRVTLNVCLRFKTKHSKKLKRFIQLEGSQMAGFKAEEVLPDNSGKLNRLRSCIKQLNEADKAVISLYLESLPYREISAITGLAENTIAVKIKRIKKKLLNCINEGL
ncbi:MAG: RNA polymerase sigma factor [Flavobacteriaceae bacterium]